MAGSTCDRSSASDGILNISKWFFKWQSNNLDTPVKDHMSDIHLGLGNQLALRYMKINKHHSVQKSDQLSEMTIS